MKLARDDARRGAALIEALLSLVLLGTAGASLLMLLGQTRETMHSARATELLIDSASAELERMVSFRRDALIEQVGWTISHHVAVHVEQPSPALFDVTVARAPGRAPLVETTLYRPDSSDDR
jgi:Tfp pilus assembly protein PilV